MNLFLPFSQLLLLLLIFFSELRNIAVFVACLCSASLMLEQFFLSLFSVFLFFLLISGRWCSVWQKIISKVLILLLKISTLGKCVLDLP